ncbi:MAG: sulfite exporter TauE/SafE family protein [Candidatus Obscuribacterales bacterium]|nr:sulfite exporter TauE/SafE family protein [Candidatus Obscuribacterales bacterium]
MTEIPLTLLLFFASIIAGIFGALSGLGGGSILTPLLTLAFGVDLRYAIGTSLISVIATSSGSASAYLKEGYTNVKLAIFLALATTFGAIAGAMSATYFNKSILSIIFGAVLLQSAWMSLKPSAPKEEMNAPNKTAQWLELYGTCPTTEGVIQYRAQNVPTGFSLMFLAGWLSGLLGIGSGAIKVLAMDRAMKLPFKVSTTTSNFMIGITAAASAGIYLSRGYIDPILAAPVMLGVLTGSLIGAKLLPKVQNKILRSIFTVLVALIGIQMISKGLRGGGS